ncbi:hypothetical protein G6F42_024186 [Rhizopus arrhizus]|nr:hypothetical protein G6F42_024186 [Rhizopus arrhizus]
MLDQGDHGNASWEQLNDYLVSRGLLTVLTQAASAEMERDIMYDATMSANQKAIFDQILQRISLNNNMHWIMGSAGTAAYNIHGKTIDRFFVTSNNIQHVSMRKLNNQVKLYKKSNFFFIDGFSMASKEAINSISSGLISVTDRHRRFGGIAVILFGDVGQLLPVSRSHPPPPNI